MSILQSLHRDFRIDANEPAADSTSISALTSFVASHSLRVPPDFLAIVREATEVEILVRGQGYIRIWSAEGACEMNAAYDVQANIPNALAVGDDEGGGALLVVEGGGRAGLYLVPFGCLDLTEGTFIAPSLRAFLVNGVGASLVFPDP